MTQAARRGTQPLTALSQIAPEPTVAPPTHMHKEPRSQGIRDRAGLAPGLLEICLAMLLTTSSACLISPVDPPLATPDLNIPPAIIEASVLPRLGTDGVVRVSCDGQELATYFEVRQVAEYNTEQTLYFSWFVDYTADALAVNRVPFHESFIEPLGDAVVRDVNQKVRVPLNWLPTSATVGPHLVEVIVADAAPLPGGLYPYRSLPEGALSDQYHWSIEVLDDASCQ